MPHQWSREDDIVAYYLYRFGVEYSIPSMSDFKAISKILGMSEASLKMRIGNFQALAGAGGLEHYAKLSKEVYDEYKISSKDNLLRRAKEIMAKKTRT